MPNLSASINFHTRLAQCAAAFLLVLFLAPPLAFSAVMPGLDMAIEQKKQSAISLLQASRHEEAYAAFMQLLREEPDNDDINMGIALSATATERYPQALMAYERLLLKYPENANLRVRIAKVYVALDEPESARLELAKAKDYDPELSDEMIARVLGQLEAQSSRWQFQGRIGAGVIYDDNANQGPRSNFITLGAFEDLFVDGVAKEDSWGSYLSGSLEAGYRLGDNSPWWVMGDVFGYQRWNFSEDINTNNRFSYGRGAFGIRRIGENTFFDLRLKADIVNQHHRDSEDQDIFGFGPELSFAFAPHQRVQFISRATLDKRDHSVSSERDGLYFSATEYLRVFVGESNHELMLGLGLSGNDPDVEAYQYLGLEPSLRLVFKLPHDVSFSPFVSFKEDNYEGPATGLETEDRSDKQWRAGAMLAWEVNDSLTLDVNYQHIYNNSNSALYDYRQNVISAGVSYKF